MVANGPELRERRIALGVTQAELAQAAGLSDFTVSKAEKGLHVSDRSLRTLDAALQAFEGETSVNDDAAPVTPSDPRPNVRPNTVRIRTAALGVEFEATYTDSADREAAMRTITAAMTELLKETGGRGATSDAEDQPGV